MQYTNLLEESLEAWQWTRCGLIEELLNLPGDRFDFKPTPASRSIVELGLHIVESGLMMVGELTRADGDFTRQDFGAFISEYAGDLPRTATQSELIALLEGTHEAGAKAFRNAGELSMLQFIKRFDGNNGTRLAWMAHGIAHEEYHRGQLALYARLMGHVPALTQLIIKHSGNS